MAVLLWQVSKYVCRRKWAPTKHPAHNLKQQFSTRGLWPLGGPEQVSGGLFSPAQCGEELPLYPAAEASLEEGARVGRGMAAISPSPVQPSPGLSPAPCLLLAWEGLPAHRWLNLCLPCHLAPATQIARDILSQRALEPGLRSWLLLPAHCPTAPPGTGGRGTHPSRSPTVP